MARVRSPDYPNISLVAALDRIRKVHAVEGTNEMSRESLVQILGYSGLTGPSGKLLSSLGKYGLTTKTGPGDVKISELAMDIMYGEPDQKNAALIEAMNSPVLFAEIKLKWPDRPPTEHTLRSFLARKGFSIKVLNRVIAAYRDTVSLVSDESGRYNTDSEKPLDEGEPKTMQQSPSLTDPSQTPPPMPSGDSMRVSITSNGLEVTARLGDVQAIDKLIKTLEATKILYQPVHGALATEYTDDEKGREAEERDRNINIPGDQENGEEREDG